MYVWTVDGDIRMGIGGRIYVVATIDIGDLLTFISSGSSQPSAIMTVRIWELPEQMLYNIACFAVPPTFRAAFLCQAISTLSQAARKSILEEEKSVGLWDLVLSGDYGTEHYERRKRDGKERRSCKRLRRSIVDQVRDAHRILKDNSEIAYYYLWEMSYSNKKNSLSRARLCGLLDEYGPNLMFNRQMSSGGNFLVEVCRSKNTSQKGMLQCVQELVERRGTMVDLQTCESATSFLTALCVAAARGMPRIVEYLLDKGARKDILCSGQFRLFIKKTKNITCVKVTAYEFAQRMLQAELAEGASKPQVKDLRRCVDLLRPIEVVS
jgi:hypothetical protein